MSDTITLSRDHAQHLLNVLQRSTTVIEEPEQDAMLALIIELEPERAARAAARIQPGMCGHVWVENGTACTRPSTEKHDTHEQRDEAGKLVAMWADDVNEGQPR